MKFLASCEGTDISVTVTEFPSVVVAEAKQVSGKSKKDDYPLLMSKNKNFFDNWKHDPRPMVTRYSGENVKYGMTLRVLTVDFTDGDTVCFTEEPSAGNYWDESWNSPMDERSGIKAVRCAHIIKTFSRSRATKGGSTGQIVDFLLGGAGYQTSSTSSGT